MTTRSKPLATGVEVHGNVLQFTVSGFRIVPSIALGYFAKFGLISPKPGEKPALQADAWYDMNAWIQVFTAIYREVGPTTMFEVGRQVGASHPVPPHVTNIMALLRFLDIGYHTNHRLNGQLMADIETGVMLEGIGHYKIDVTPGQREAVTVCDNPYPCEFDLGLMGAATSRFEAKARTTHDPHSPCRAKGGDSCTYLTTW